MTVTALSASSLLDPVLNLHGPLAYAIVAAFAFAEAALFVGFVLPGETAVVLGGVIASRGHVNLGVEIVVVVLAAVLGDSTGYEVGRHFGARVLEWPLLERRRPALDRARAYLQAKGGRAVFLGRFTAFLRAVMPGLAGSARMPYGRFLAFNAAGAVVWGAGFTVVGYLAGESYKKVEKVAGRFSLGLLAVIVALLVANHLRRRR